MKYRKKPVTVEAVQWDGTPEDATPIINWILDTGERAAHWDEGRIYINTLEGTMAAEPGDYVIRGVAGEFYPCKPDIFEATYEPVESDG